MKPYCTIGLISALVAVWFLAVVLTASTLICLFACFRHSALKYRAYCGVGDSLDIVLIPIL